MIKGILVLGVCLAGFSNRGGTAEKPAPLDGNALEALDVGETDMIATPALDIDKDARMQWWRDARFGCFVHWGAFSALGNQWRGRKGGGYAEHIQRVLKISMADYKADAIDKFNPTKFNADEWIAMAKKAGMGYFVITAKHHDGFAMFDSKVSDYNIVKQTPWKRDPMRELKDACDRQGIRFGMYYSHAFDWGEPNAPGNDWEWNNPGGDRRLHGGSAWWTNNPQMLERVRKRYVDAKSIPQIKELARFYQPDLLWFDTPHKLPASENERILDELRKVAPDTLVNGRLVRSDGDYLSTGDRAVEFLKLDTDWEAIPTTNESYGWNPFDKSHKTPEFLVQTLCKAVSRGGSILLNIGPRDDGSIDPVDVAILEGIGKWMNMCAEAIHGCGACDLPVQDWGVVTAKDKSLYLHVFDWPTAPLGVGGLRSDPVKASLLTPEGLVPLKWKRITAQDLAITLPAKAVNRAASVIKLEFEQKPSCGGVRLLSDSNRNQLLAFDAELHRDGNNETTGFGYGDGKKNNYVVKNWKHTSQWMSWEVRLNTATSFDTSLRYGICKGGTYELSCGDWKQACEAKVSPKKDIPGIAKAGLDPIGRLELPAGVHRISLRLTKTNPKGEEALRPLELWLKPVEQN